MQVIEGSFNAKNLKFGIVASRFNQPITERLLDGACDCLLRHGASKESVTICWVPGAFEIPLMAKKMATSKHFDAVICIGTVIRGETSHFDYVASQAASGILESSLSSGVPVIFALLTTETREQAEERAGIKLANVGFTYALSAIEMANLLKSLTF